MQTCFTYMIEIYHLAQVAVGKYAMFFGITGLLLFL